MTFEEYIEDMTFPDREVVFIDCGPREHYDAQDVSKQVGVFVFAYEGKHFVVTPFAHGPELTVEIAGFDVAGLRKLFRIYTITEEEP